MMTLQQQQLHSALFSAMGNKFKSFLLILPYKTHGKRFIDALGSCLVDVGGLVSSQQLEVQFIDVISILDGNMKHARAIGFD